MSGPPARIDWNRVRDMARAGATRGQRAWGNLSEDERRELWEIVRRCGGNPRRLSRTETKRLGSLLARALR